MVYHLINPSSIQTFPYYPNISPMLYFPRIHSYPQGFQLNQRYLRANIITTWHEHLNPEPSPKFDIETIWWYLLPAARKLTTNQHSERTKCQWERRSL